MVCDNKNEKHGEWKAGIPLKWGIKDKKKGLTFAYIGNSLLLCSLNAKVRKYGNTIIDRKYEKVFGIGFCHVCDSGFYFM